MHLETLWNHWDGAQAFSGVFTISSEEGVLFQRCQGYRNRSEGLPNNPDTAFGIASGTKLFTGLTVCRLIESGRLSLQDTLGELLPYDLGQIDRRITIYQLLTHTSGVGDYIDEDDPDCDVKLEALYRKYPVYALENLSDYLPAIIPLPPKAVPGSGYCYSNSGYILLGLVIEEAAGKPFSSCVQDEIIAPLRLLHTGFYATHALPANTAYGYMEDAQGQWHSNIFHIPIRGGSDGGLYTCAMDLDRLWRALFAGRILSPTMLQAFLGPQVPIREGLGYGLGVYCRKAGTDTVYYAEGGDFGIDFFTAYFPRQQIVVTALGNTQRNALPLLDALSAAILG